MTLPVIIMPEAEEALWANAEWWAKNHSPEQALRWYDGFADAILSLGDHPHRYPLARANDQFPYEVRVMNYGVSLRQNYGVSLRPTHRALYTVRPNAVVDVSIRSAKQKDATPNDL